MLAEMEMASLGKMAGAIFLGLAAAGSAFGAGAAAPAAIGAWKKCYAQNKSVPFMLLAFIGAPLSQTIYGMIIMNRIVKICTLSTYLPATAIKTAQDAAGPAAASNWLSFIPADVMASATQAMAAQVINWPTMLGVGIAGGAAMGLSAWLQGVAGAAASDALAETGQGAGNYLMALGIIETVAIFVLVFIGRVLA
jgi:V/A-type H+-transporting ATPase subunit K